MEPKHIVFKENTQEWENDNPHPTTYQDSSETLEYYKRMTVHPSGISKDKIPQKAELTQTDAALEAFYSERYADVDVAGFLENERKERLFGLCNMVKPGESFLDIGCANGGHMNVLYQRGIHGIGLDLAITNILRGREKYPHLKFIHGFAEEISFSDNFFDVVLLGDVIEHFRDPKEVLSECLRVARKGVIICVPIKEEITEEHINPFNVDSIHSLLDIFNLKEIFYNSRGEEISKEMAISDLSEFPWLLIRAEKSENFDTEIKKYRGVYSSKIEGRRKTELLDNDQWKRGDFHSRDPTEIARFNLISHLVEGNRVLEIGSGNGDSTLALQKTGCVVIGVDISEVGIRDAYQYSKTHDSYDISSFCLMDATALAFADNTFDTVVIPEVIEHVMSSLKIFQEAIRVVRNGGRIIFSVPDGLLVPWNGHLRIFFKDTLMSELSQYSDVISWHDLPFKKWIIGSFFVKKEHPRSISGPAIDILMPSYNGRMTIERAIRSVIDQTYKNWNLIIINDGGEELRDIIEKFHDPRIKYLASEHKGKSHALNIGLQNSDEKYISYLDDDDILYPIHLEELIKGILKENAEFVYTDWYEVSYDDKNREFRREIEFRQDVTPDMLITQNYINHKCILHSRKLLNEIGLYDEDLSVLIDWDIIRRMSFKAKPVHIWSLTSERIRYYDNNTLTNRITGLWTRDKNKAMKSVMKIVHKTDTLGATAEDLNRALKRAMVVVSYYNYPLIQGLNENNKILNESIVTKDDQILELKGISQSLQQENEALRRSITHKVTTKLHRIVVERLFPPATERRRFYDLGLDGGRILINEGGSKFWERVHEKISLGWEIDPINNYQLWIKKNESEYRHSNTIKKEVKLLRHLPKISIVVPVWDVDIKWLKLMIKSVLSQVYENWELCIVDADSKNTSIKEILTHYQNKDPRIKVKFLNENLGISGNTNEAMDMVTGDFVGFLDHDDELAPFALYEVVKYINNHPGVKLVYSDEDKITNTGIRLDPFFKPDWAPDHFLSQNYLCHFCVIEKEILTKTGKLRKEFDGSQDYDLLLRLTEILDNKDIGHIRRILYHWRVVPTSTSNSINAKPYVIANSKKAIKESLIRRTIAAEVCEGILPDTYRVKYLIRGKPLVSIIIPTKDNPDDLHKCIQSILNKTTYDNYEIIIVNNDSKRTETYRLFDDLKRDSRIKIIDYPEKFNFSLINNFAVGHTRGEFIVFLNNDTEVIADEWLTAMLEHAQRKEVGAVGAKLIYPDNTIQHAGVILGIGSRKSAVAGHPHKYFNTDSPGYFSSLNIIRNFSAVTAACMMMRKDIFLEVGGFDKNLKIAFNDVELCIKVRNAGYFIVYTPFALLYHYESKSRGYEDTPEKNKRFNSEIKYIRTKWGNVIDRGDPFYNSNLTLLKEDFSLNT